MPDSLGGGTEKKRVPSYMDKGKGIMMGNPTLVSHHLVKGMGEGITN